MGSIEKLSNALFFFVDSIKHIGCHQHDPLGVGESVILFPKNNTHKRKVPSRSETRGSSEAKQSEAALAGVLD